MRHSNVIYRGLLLASAATLTTTVAAPAIAQESPAAADGDTIVVMGSIRQSQDAGIEEKRIAVNVADIASADSVGRFPDENIAAALTRLPGVAVQRDQGQARYIQVRGAPNRWTSVSIDGIPQTGTDEQSAARAYRFDSVPAVILSQLRVNKSLTPDITAEAVTANVDLVTFSALGTDGLSVNGDLGYGWMDLGGGEQRQGSIRFNYGGENWGLVVGGSHYKRRQVTDNREFGYSTGTDGQLAPTDIDVRSYILDRSTNGLFANFEIEPSDGAKVFLRGIYTEFKDDEQRNAYQFELDEADSGTRTATGGDLIGVPVDGAFNDAAYRNRNTILSGGFELEGDSWTVDVTLGYTKTENSTDLPLTLTSTPDEADVSLTYDRSDPLFPVITSLNSTIVDPMGGPDMRGPAISTFDVNTLDGFTFVLPIVTNTKSDTYTGKIDASYDTGDVLLRFGALAQSRDIFGNVFNDAGIVILSGTPFDLDTYQGGAPWDTNFPLGVTFNYTDNPQLDADQDAFYAANNIDLFALNPDTDFFDQKETILAPYVMGEFEVGDLQVIAGVRGEYYKIESGSPSTNVVIEQDFFDIFPSVNLRFEASDDFIVRGAFMRGTARPAYSAIRVSNAIDDMNETIDSGNPFLRPEYTWGLDGSLEYYLPSNGLLSVAVFHRWVEDVLYVSTQPVGSDAFNSNGIDRSNYLISGSFNGGNGTVTGIEFNAQHQFDFLPGPLGGFGVQGNVTFLDGEFDAFDQMGGVVVSDFPGLSDTIVNAGVFYEKYGLSALIAYQWRSDYIDTIGGLGIGDGEFRGSYENLDISIRYAVTDNFTVFADLANLTDEIYTAFDGSPEFPTEVEQIGSRYLFGIRFDF